MMTAASAAAGRQSFLVVFDFDHTVVDCNTDEVVPQQLGCGDHLRSLMKAQPQMQWTKLVDTVVAPFTRAQIEGAVKKSVVMEEGMPEVFRFLQQQQQLGQQGDNPAASSQVEIAIASDANHVFIETAIAHHIPFARQGISQIHSNSFHDVTDGGEARRCRLTWYEPEGHNCTCCNMREHPNMCKSRIISRLLHTSRLIDPTVIFIGDGANDYCPVINVLRPRDYMFARRGFPIHRLLSNETEAGGCCKIGLWADARELLQNFQRAMSPAERLPTLVRFRDAGPHEFRNVTLLKRIPQVLERTLKDNDNYTSDTGRKLINALIKATHNNDVVAPLPGQATVPVWLQSFAMAPEYDHDIDSVERQKMEGGAIAPRWGQLPWLHGEIYFYNLIAQYLMLAEGSSSSSGGGDDKRAHAVTTERVPNIVTPYAICSPIGTHDCSLATHAMVSAKGATPLQSFDPSFLAQGGLKSVTGSVLLHDGRMNYNAIAVGDTVELPRTHFQSYRDFFTREKHEVLQSFLKVKICPMLACVPWEAGDGFVDVLLRWMLWGNSVDLSMFTLEQLQEKHQGAYVGAAGNDTTHIDALRAAEAASVSRQDDNIVGNQVDQVAQLVRRIVRSEPRDATTPRSIDIVMDNVGVECVADLIFALWVLQHHPSLRVTLHVKCMPYYVSDVTPPDFAFLVDQLERCAEREPEMSKFLLRFVQLIREAFSNGRLRIDADQVWIQPCEYRELPPRVCNTFFYTQRLLSAEELQQPPQQQQQQQQQGRASCPFTRCRRFKALSALVIFKGDLNFRRLVGDRHWDARAFMTTLSPAERASPSVTTTLLADTPSAQWEEAPSFERIVSAFWPVHIVPVCAIRTVKSEGAVGVAAARQDVLDRANPDWKTSGKCGTILLAASDASQHE
ncbi:Phosphoethanolamine/phosphocholine phosphatase [Trypanosoma grayi]|uniref:Phosphoethanolamine/phosphocholine phosphatase n=1 Tax=Trypanosoma grayi TaxID=71804 RepID=UPI0004F41C0F|nr:Phosphoethanolamine/phosphocholine phosphatase [Trypanosoma grayi]KEG11730.1 Phosphoethanolamine/phosphocholine phosphatase [Trypanosoma grayi]